MQEEDLLIVQELDIVLVKKTFFLYLPLVQEEDLHFVPKYGARCGIKYDTTFVIIFCPYFVSYLVP